MPLDLQAWPSHLRHLKSPWVKPPPHLQLLATFKSDLSNPPMNVEVHAFIILSIILFIVQT